MKLDNNILITEFISTTKSLIIKQKYGSIINCTLKYKDKKFKFFMSFWEKVDLTNLTMDDCFNYIEHTSNEDNISTSINCSELNSLIKHYNKYANN